MDFPGIGHPEKPVKWKTENTGTSFAHKDSIRFMALAVDLYLFSWQTV
jgi:hypothetical protein